MNFCRRPGNIANDDIPLIGSSQFTHYKEDVKLMKELGLKAYRLSIAWPRIFPEGDGAPNPRGLDYYNRLIDELLANGIEPWVTMFHWDMPQSLERRFGGWRSKETSKRLGDYVAYVAPKISDRVSRFFTVNEIPCFTSAGYGDGVFPPGLKLDAKTVRQCVHNGCLAHGYAVQALRANAVRPVKIGLVDNCTQCVPVFESAANIVAARNAFRLVNADRLTVIREGAYPAEFLADVGKDAPEYTDAELKIIASPTDFLGLNLYTPEHVIADSAAPRGYRIVPKAANHPRMYMPWLALGPEIIYWTCRYVSELWSVPELYITENGCAAADKLEKDGEVYDTDRLMYLRNHFISAHRAVSEGYPLKGYFVWSLLDNFEWACGFQKRFGIVYVNYQTLARTPKLSAKFYQEVIRQNAVV